MNDDRRSPYAPPSSEAAAPPAGSSGFARYEDVPYYRRQWFFWLFFFTFAPVAIAILISGDVYYVKRGEVRGFGILNRIVAGVIGAIWALQFIAALAVWSS